MAVEDGEAPDWNDLEKPHYFRIIMRHFLAAAVDPAVSLSTYSTLPMEVIP